MQMQMHLYSSRMYVCMMHVMSINQLTITARTELHYHVCMYVCMYTIYSFPPITPSSISTYNTCDVVLIRESITSCYALQCTVVQTIGPLLILAVVV